MKENDLVQAALDLHQAGYNCAQSVFSVFAPDFGLAKEKSLMIASCFGGGMRMGSVCGALTGALMVLGLAKGFSVYSPEIKADSETHATQFIGIWKEQVGEINCRDILDVDVSDPEQRQLAKQNGVFDAHCPDCIEKAVRIVSRLI